MRHRIAELYQKEGKAKGIDVSNVRVAIHNACHVYKMIADDYPFDPEVYNGQRPAASTAVVRSLRCSGGGLLHMVRLLWLWF